MTSYTKFQCDGCNKEFEREALITWGIDTHFCMSCTIREIHDLADNITTKIRTLDFNNEYGWDVLESTYSNLRQTCIELATYENGEWR